MKVTINTYSQRTVAEILPEIFGLDLESITWDNSTVTLIFKDDLEYREIAGWIGAALGCGLITGGNIER